MRWPFGLLEGISLVYFIGYAVTYSLHVAHLYAGNPRDEKNTEYEQVQKGWNLAPMQSCALNVR